MHYFRALYVCDTHTHVWEGTGFELKKVINKIKKRKRKRILGKAKA